MKSTLAVTSILAISLLFSGCTSHQNSYRLTKHYRPDDPALYKTIVDLDSAFFEAYNTCDINLDRYSAFYTEDIEFYHDKGGFANSKPEIVESTKKYVCGKVTRQLVKGSIEVYPVPGYGAIEIGLHKFYNREEPDHKPHTGRFTIVWRQENGDWKIAKVISLH